MLIGASVPAGAFFPQPVRDRLQHAHSFSSKSRNRLQHFFLVKVRNHLQHARSVIVSQAALAVGVLTA